MKVMVIVKASKSSEAGEMPSQELLTEMGQYNEELAKAGIMLDGAGLHPSSRATRIVFSGSNRLVVNGPFAETKELIAGFWMWRVKSMEEAIEWARRCPCPNPGEDEPYLEIRPVFEADDFGEAFTPELREQEAAVLAVGRGLEMPSFQDAPELIIAGLQQHYTRATRATIPQQWQRFVPMMNSMPGRSGADSFGVCWNTNEDCEFDYLTGVEVTSADQLPAGLSSVTLKAGRYAVFKHSGHVSSIDQTIDTIWSKWALDCGLKLAGTHCFERYTPEFNPETATGGIEIWIPLESA